MLRRKDDLGFMWLIDMQEQLRPLISSHTCLSYLVCVSKGKKKGLYARAHALASDNEIRLKAMRRPGSLPMLTNARRCGGDSSQ